MAAASGTAAFEALYGQMAAKSQDGEHDHPDLRPRPHAEDADVPARRNKEWRSASSTIKLAKPWQMMLLRASQKSVAPYWAETPGPNSHSPVRCWCRPALRPARSSRSTAASRPPRGRWQLGHFPRGQHAGRDGVLTVSAFVRSACRRGGRIGHERASRSGESATARAAIGPIVAQPRRDVQEKTPRLRTFGERRASAR